MELPSLSTALVVAVVLVAGGLAALQLGLVPAPTDYERTTVAVIDANGTRLATVDVRVADTARKRYVGLSETASLAPGDGMLFVHEEAGRHTYVMREMDFPLDIVFIAADGTITTIHHAPVPEATPEEDLRSYPGHGKYVLEVPMGYTNATGIDAGDRVRIRGRWGESTR